MFLSKLSAGDWAAWVQAVGVFAAILFAGRTATVQARLQFENSLRLQQQEDVERKRMLAAAVVEIIRATAVRIKHVKSSFPDRETISLVAEKARYYDLDGLTDVIYSLKQIPLHHLPSPNLVAIVVNLISTTRQLNIQVDKALKEYRTMDASKFDAFINTLAQISSTSEKMELESAACLAAIKSN